MATANPEGVRQLKESIRDVPDFPKPGIVFKDITPVLKDPKLFHICIDEMIKAFEGTKIDHVVGIESRGFIFGAAMAYKLGAGLVIVRKPKKLPFKTTQIEYSLEYGKDTLEMHTDALDPGDRVLIVDDILATGGTAAATAQLVEKMGAKLEGLVFMSELAALNGKEKLGNYNVHSVLSL